MTRQARASAVARSRAQVVEVARTSSSAARSARPTGLATPGVAVRAASSASGQRRRLYGSHRRDHAWAHGASGRWWQICASHACRGKWRLQIRGLHHRRGPCQGRGGMGGRAGRSRAGGGCARWGSPPAAATPAPTRGDGWRPCCRMSRKGSDWTTSRRGGGCSCAALAAGSAAPVAARAAAVVAAAAGSIGRRLSSGEGEERGGKKERSSGGGRR